MKPILFNADMVRAILEGRKTVTRRVVKLKYSNTHLEMFTNKYGTRLIEKQNEEPGVTTIKNSDGTMTHTLLACIEKAPPYRPGDTLYVRETWSRSMAGTYLYRATDIPFIHDRWNPSIHMPREAARIFLRVTDVRVERLQDIVNANLKMSIFAETECHFSAVSIVVYTALIHSLTCWLEARQALIYQLVLGLTGENGKYNYSRAVHLYPPFFDITCSAKNYKIAPALTDITEKDMQQEGVITRPLLNDFEKFISQKSFALLWDSTIKPADRALYDWEANPWVWVIEFERCERPGAPSP